MLHNCNCFAVQMGIEYYINQVIRWKGGSFHFYFTQSISNIRPFNLNFWNFVGIYECVNWYAQCTLYNCTLHIERLCIKASTNQHASEFRKYAIIQHFIYFAYQTLRINARVELKSKPTIVRYLSLNDFLFIVFRSEWSSHYHRPFASFCPTFLCL